MTPVQAAEQVSSGVSIRALLRLALLVAALVVVNRGSWSLLSELQLLDWSSWTLGLGILIYALALSIPFVPGAELGVGLMVIFGRPGVVLVYLGTLLGLSLAFMAGRRLPPSLLMGLLDWLRLAAARDRIRALIEGSPGQAMAQVHALAPKRLGPRLARHRYLVLALAINLPGNVLIGGGGGIALLAGLSGRFRYLLFLATCSVAVAPVPLLFLLASVSE